MPMEAHFLYDENSRQAYTAFESGTILIFYSNLLICPVSPKFTVINSEK
jgi:hypothetical protein